MFPLVNELCPKATVSVLMPEVALSKLLHNENTVYEGIRKTFRRCGLFENIRSLWTCRVVDIVGRVGQYHHHKPGN